MEPFTTLFAADEDSLLAFRWRLAEAIAWAEHFPLPAAHLPSTYPLQSPYQRILGADAISQTYFTDVQSQREQEAPVGTIIAKRRTMLHEVHHYPREPATDLAGGALLLHYPDDNLHDGAAAPPSQWFFTTDNVPPCETWISLIADTAGRIHLSDNAWTYTSSNRALISYIAEPLRGYAEDGVAVNPEMCLLWAHTLDSPFTRLLSAAKIITQAWSTPDSLSA